MWGLPGAYLYHVLIGARLWLPRKRQDAGREADGGVNFHLLLVPHRHVQRMDPSVLQGVRAPHIAMTTSSSAQFSSTSLPLPGDWATKVDSVTVGEWEVRCQRLCSLSPWRWLSMAL